MIRTRRSVRFVSICVVLPGFFLFILGNICVYAQMQKTQSREVKRLTPNQEALELPHERALLVTSLVRSLLDKPIDELPSDEFQRVCWQLEMLKAVEVAPILARYTTVRIRMTSTDDRDLQYPATKALVEMGIVVVPDVFHVLADKKLVRDSTNYRPPQFQFLPPQELALMNYKPEADVFLQFSSLVSGNATLARNTQTIINEYTQKSVRLRLLKAYLPEPKEGAAPEDIKVSVEVPTLFASDDEARVAKVLELHYTLTDQLAPSTEAQVLTAVADAQKLKAFELAPDLCDKLDPTPPPKVESVLAANPKGRLSPAIADASEAALRAMGSDALPALLDAVSMAGRGPAYRTKAMSLIFAATGSEEASRATLESAAKQNDERAARLRLIIEGNTKPAP